MQVITTTPILNKKKCVTIYMFSTSIESFRLTIDSNWQVICEFNKHMFPSGGEHWYTYPTLAGSRVMVHCLC